MTEDERGKIEPDEIVEMFKGKQTADREKMLADMLAAEAANSGVLHGAVKAASEAASRSEQGKEVFAEIFPGVSTRERFRLYRNLLWGLIGLALSGLVGGFVILWQTDKESAVFFMFAGLALGGIAGILAPTPSGGA